MANQDILELEQALEQAPANTEAELGRDLWKDEDVPQGDRSLEEMPDHLGQDLEGDEPEETEVDDGGEEVKAKEASRDEQGKFTKADTKVASEPQQQQEGRVPSGRLKAEADARRAAEEQANQAKAEAAAAKAELAAINAKMDGILAGLNRPAPPPAAKPQDAPQAPDMFADPVGYTNWLRAEINRENSERLLNSSLADAHEAHGKEFEEAYANLTRNPHDPATRAAAQRIMSAPNPGRALMKWHGEQRTLAEVGADPNAYRTKIETEARAKLLKDPEIRKQILAEMRQEAASGEQPRSVTRLPKSLNGVGGGASSQYFDRASADGGDRALVESLFSDQ